MAINQAVGLNPARRHDNLQVFKSGESDCAQLNNPHLGFDNMQYKSSLNKEIPLFTVIIYLLFIEIILQKLTIEIVKIYCYI